MERVVRDIRGLHKEIDEMLEEKLKAIDHCMENSKECPCGEGKCEIAPEKFEEIENLYSELFTDKKLEKQFEELKKKLNLDKE